MFIHEIRGTSKAKWPVMGCSLLWMSNDNILGLDKAPIGFPKGSSACQRHPYEEGAKSEPPASCDRRLMSSNASKLRTPPRRPTPQLSSQPNRTLEPPYLSTPQLCDHYCLAYITFSSSLTQEPSSPVDTHRYSPTPGILKMSRRTCKSSSGRRR